MFLCDVIRQHEQILNNILPVLLKTSNCTFYTHTHTEKLHKMQILFISNLFCIYILNIAVAFRHFMLFPCIIIYHLITPKCFLQSENFINNPFPCSLFICTLECKSRKHLSSCIREIIVKRQHALTGSKGWRLWQGVETYPNASPKIQFMFYSIQNNITEFSTVNIQPLYKHSICYSFHYCNNQKCEVSKGNVHFTYRESWKIAPPHSRKLVISCCFLSSFSSEM